MSNLLPRRIYASDLLIGRWTTSDAEAMTSLIVDSLAHLRPWMAWAANEPLSLSRRLDLFKRWDQYWATGKGAIYSIRATDRLVGGCALHRQPDKAGVEIGYWLGQHAIGQGIATQTASALHDAALALPDVTYVQISHDPSNFGSAGVPRRLGFTRLTPTPGANVTTWRSTTPAQPPSN